MAISTRFVVAPALTRSRALERVRDALGWLALATAFALLSPGVVAVASAEPADGPSCSSGSERAERFSVALEHQIEMMQAQAAAQQPAGDEWVMLDNRGYNYRPTPAPVAEPVSREPAQR